MVRSDRRKRYISIAAGTVLLLVCVLFVPQWAGDSTAPPSISKAAQVETDEAAVATVNGTAVTLKEFKVRMPEQRAETMTYYQQTYGCDPAEASFWGTSCGGQLPQERLKEMTLQRLVEDRVRELAAQAAGLHTTVGYEAFLADWEAENRERAERVAAGKVIYGPRQYSEPVYYRYVVSSTVLGLKQWLEERDGPPTQEQLRQEYAASIAGQAHPPSYEKAKDAVLQSWTDKRYASWFKEQMKQAAVKVDQQVYKGISM
ncbi:hypothetical protein D3C76_150960 [compost metagenome]